MAKWTIEGTRITDNREQIVTVAVVKELEYHGEWMGDEFVTVTVKSEVPVEFRYGDYLTYRGETFVIDYEPNFNKKARKESYGEAFTYENIKLYTLARQLRTIAFKDYVLNWDSDSNKNVYSSQDKFSFFAASVEDLADRIQANLDRTGQRWYVMTPSNTRTNQRSGNNGWGSYYTGNEPTGLTDVNITCDSIKCDAALKMAYDNFGLSYIIKDRTIIIGSKSTAPIKMFEYGKGKGLAEIEGSIDESQEVVTRLYAYGSEKNMPRNFYANKSKNVVFTVACKSEREYISQHPTLNLWTNKTMSLSKVKSIFGASQKATLKFGNLTIGATVSVDKYNMGPEQDDPTLEHDVEYVYFALDAGGFPTYDDTAARRFYNAVSIGSTVDLPDADKNTAPADWVVIPAGYNYPGLLAVNNLMLPGFPDMSLYAWVVANGGTVVDADAGKATWNGITAIFSKEKMSPWVQSENAAVLGVREGTAYFDGSNEVDEIFPTIEGTGADVVVVGSDVKDNGYLPDKADESMKKFTIDVANSILDWKKANDKSTEDVIVSMKDGYNAGRNFKLVSVGTDTAYDGDPWKLTLEREQDTSIGRYFPYFEDARSGYCQVMAGNHFVVTGIELPESYVDAAAVRLLLAALQALDEVDHVRKTLLPKIDEIYMQREHDAAATGTSLHDRLKPGLLLGIGDDDVVEDKEDSSYNKNNLSSYIDHVTIKENGNNGIPTYDVVLRDRKEEDFRTSIEKKIVSISGGSVNVKGGLTIGQVTEVTDELYPMKKDAYKTYLSIDFFNHVFEVHGKKTYDSGEVDPETGEPIMVTEDITVSPNEWPVSTAEVTYTITDIEAKYGLWTNYFISALGKNADGSGGAVRLFDLVDVQIPGTPTQENDGQALVYDFTLGKWTNKKIDAGATLNEPLSSINRAALGAPSQAGVGIVWDGTAWIYRATNAGSVTSVSLTAPTGFTVTGSPVTSSGTLALTFAEGYSLPTTAKQGQWDNAASWVSTNGANVATKEWVGQNYISIAFFNRIFQAYKSSTISDANKLLPNDVTSAIDNLKIMVGAWTDQYLSALGLSDGGSGAASLLSELLDVELTSPSDNQVLTYYNGKWRNMASQGTDMTSVWAALAANGNEQINVSHLSTALSGYFTNGVANSALRLSDDTAHTIWGQTYWSTGVPQNVDGAIRANVSTIGESLTLTGSYSGGYNCISYVLSGITNTWSVGIQSRESTTDYYIWSREVGRAFTILSGGNVGIGTSAPAFKLDVNGSARVTNRLYLYKHATDSTKDVYLEYVSANGGVHLAGGGLYADTFVSALGLSNNGGGVVLNALLEALNESGLGAHGSANTTVVWNGSAWTFGTTGLDQTELTNYLSSKTLTLKNGQTTLGTYTPTAASTIDLASSLTGYLTQANADLRYLQLTGGTLSLAAIGLFTVKNTSSDYPLIRFEGKDAGGIGFLGIGKTGSVINPYFVTADANGGYTDGVSQWYTLLHTGNWTNFINLTSLGAASSSSVTTLQGYFTNGVANQAARLSGTSSYTAWGRTYWSSGVPQNVSGNIDLNKGEDIRLKDGSNYYRIFGVSSSDNTLLIGWELKSITNSDTTLCAGNNLNIGYGSNVGDTTYGKYWAIFRNNGHLTINANDSSDVFLNVSGATKTTRLYLYKPNSSSDTGAVYLEYESANSGIHLVGGGLYADTYLSALGLSNTGSGTELNALLESLNTSGLGAHGAANTTVVWNGTQWTFGTTGLDQTALTNYLVTNGYITQATGDGRYLKLTGGTLSLGGIGEFTVKNTSSNYPVIRFEGNTGGGLGFIGVGKTGNVIEPYFVTADANGGYTDGISQWYRIWHSGNDSALLSSFVNSGDNVSLTVGSTTKTLTVGYSTRALRLKNIVMAAGDDYDTLSGYTADRGSFVAANINSVPSSSMTLSGMDNNWATLLSFGYNNRTIQFMGFGWSDTLKYRHVYTEPGTTSTYVLSPWKTIAFTDGNVASATRLAGTATKSAWGQTYWSNGQPQDISGNIEYTGNITPSASYASDIGARANYYRGVYCGYFNLIDSTTNEDFNITWYNVDGNRVLAMYCWETIASDIIIGTTSSSYGLYFDGTRGRWGIGTSVPGRRFSSENVGLKLDVAGIARANQLQAYNTAGETMLLNSTTSYDCIVFQINSASKWSVGTDSGNNFYWYTQPGGNRTVMSLTSAGVLNVGNSVKCTDLWIGNIHITYDSTNGGIHIANGGLSANTYVSALGVGQEGGGTQGLDIEALWTELSTPNSSRQIDKTHISNALSDYVTTNTLSGYATQQWVSSQGFAYASSLSNYVSAVSTSSGKLNVTKGGSTISTDIVTLRLGQTTLGDSASLATFTHSTDLIYTAKGGGNTVTDKPTGVDAFGVLSLKTAGGYYGQILLEASGELYVRSSNSLSGGWRRQLDSSNWSGVVTLSALGGASTVALSEATTRISTLEGYFNTGGVAKSAATATTASKLSTVNKTAWGQTYWTSGGVPTDISGNMSSVGNISSYGGYISGFYGFDFEGVSGNSSHGGFLDFHYGGSTDDYTTRLIERESGVLSLISSNVCGLIVGGYDGDYVQIGQIRIVYDYSNNALKVIRSNNGAANFYATGGVSALGVSDSSGGSISSSLIPSSSGEYDLGSTSYKWRNLYLYNGGVFSIVPNSSTINFQSSKKISINSDVELVDETNLYVDNRICIGSNNSSYAFYVSGNSYLTGSISASNVINRSDMRIKDFVENTDLSVDAIAEAPSFKFTFKDGDSRLRVGTSAQYWRGALPESVFSDADGMFGLDYGVTALVSVISVARKVMTHEERIKALEEENERLRNEVEQLKAA